MPQDIRDIDYIDHKDVVELNFIKPDCKYVFRRHYRQGLRSHILEILDPADIKKEKSGTLINGTLQFPKARPHRVLRIFRTRFRDVNQALEEIQRVKMTERILTPDFVARSIEILVEYHGPDGRSPLLCGLQEYISGVIVDPWTQLQGHALLSVLHESLGMLGSRDLKPLEQWSKDVEHYGGHFVENTKRLIRKDSYVPDLAGIGNILITPSGSIKLVDINNISRVVRDDIIRLDDRDYPVCDKSIEALALIEQKLLNHSPKSVDPLYKFFFAPERKKRVQEIEKLFLASSNNEHSLPNT